MTAPAARRRTVRGASLRRALLVAAGITAGLAPALSGFETLGTTWKSGLAPFHVNPNFPDRALSGSVEQQVEIVREAAAAWRDQSRADFEFLYRGTTTRSGFDPGDGVNSISWADEDGGDALAATVVGGVGNRSTYFDIVFYDHTQGIPNRWNGPRDPTSGTVDISGVAVHELGHALGLAHTSEPGATMFFQATGRGLPLRTLGADDRVGIETLYGIRGAVDFSPVLVEIAPVFGPTSGGNEVLIRGRNFTWTGDTVLRFGDNPISRNRYTVESFSTIRVERLEPGPAGRTSVSVENELGAAALQDAYRYGDPPPSIRAVEPSLGPLSGDIRIVVLGENLTAQATLSVGGAPATDLTLESPGVLSATLPPRDEPGPVDVVVRQGEDTVSLPAGFTYTASELALGEIAAPPGSDAEVVALASTDEPLRGISFAFRNDPADFLVTAITVDGTAAEGAEFASPNLDPVGGVTTFGIVMSFTAETPVIPIGEDLPVARIAIRVDPSAPEGRRSPLVLEERAGAPPVDLLFTPAGNPAGVRPWRVDGAVVITRRPLFLRGDADGSGRIELTDAVFHLDHLFRGGPAPPCADAADSNDDGELDLSDAIYTLLHLFAGGAPPPPPWPQVGPDPSADSLDC